tara:strand:- start:37 stop:222 length:186 start_codon:yes stop_codon:yes gene_type:complete
MTKQELMDMIRDYKDAIKLVSAHINLNPTSADIQMWTNQLHRLRKRLVELEECMYLGEYDE